MHDFRYGLKSRTESALSTLILEPGAHALAVLAPNTPRLKSRSFSVMAGFGIH
jgi:hypothetical protein